MALEVLVDKRPTSFAIAVNDNPILFDGSKDQDTLSSPIALEFAVRESSLEKRAAIQPGGARRRSPPPLPPKGIRPFAAADDTSTASSSPNTELHYTLALFWSPRYTQQRQTWHLTCTTTVYNVFQKQTSIQGLLANSIQHNHQPTGVQSHLAHFPTMHLQ